MHPSRQRVHLGDPLNFIPEKLNTNQVIPTYRGIHLHYIPLYPETASLQIQVVPDILHLHQLPKQLFPVLGHTGTQGCSHSLEFLRAAQTVNTGYTGYYNHIPSLGKGSGGRQTQLVYFIIYGGILGNIRIRRRHIGLGLVVIVVGHKVFYRILRKKFFKFSV